MKQYKCNLLITLFSIALITIFSSVNFAQSTDPDNPTPLNGTIEGKTSGNLYDDKTYYYSFNVKPGAINIVVDLDPVKGTGGGTIRIHYLDTKFKELMRYESYSTVNSPDRKVIDFKTRSKRKIILKIVVGGNFSYKIKVSGSGLVN